MRATTDRREPWELVIMIEWSITVRQALLVIIMMELIITMMMMMTILMIMMMMTITVIMTINCFMTIIFEIKSSSELFLLKI